MVEVLIMIVILSLGVYRISLMVTAEDGPFEIFAATREIFSLNWGDKDWRVKGIHCPMCISFWLSFIAGFAVADSIFTYVIYSLSIAGLVAFTVMIGGIPDE